MIAAVPPRLRELPELPDRELLRRFAEDRDEPAFAELVRRYAGLVGAAGRRTAGGGRRARADADDAAQHAFFSLAKNAAKLVDRMGPDRTLGGWLHRVTVNAVLQAKRGETARRRREAAVAKTPKPRFAPPDRPAETADALGVLDEELAALPAAERWAVVLCHLEGRPQREAAAACGTPFGTFRRRLDRGRSLLKKRLEARGVLAAPAVFVAALAAAGRARAGVVLHPEEAAALAADAAAGLPPPHVLPPRGRVRPAGPGGGRLAWSWEPVVSTAAGLAVGLLALWGLLDLLGGGVSDPAAPEARPVADAPAGPRYSARRML